LTTINIQHLTLFNMKSTWNLTWSPDVCRILAFSYWIFHFQVAIESVLLIEDPKVARQVIFQNPPAKARMVSLGWWIVVVQQIVITKVFNKQLRIKSSDNEEWRFDGSMPSVSNSNKIRYVSSLYSEWTCEGLSAYD